MDPTAQPLDEERRAKLMQTVSRRIREAMDARRSSGIEEVWQEDEDQYNGFDELSPPASRQTEEGQRKRLPGGRSVVFLPLTKPKTDAGISRVQEMLLPTDDKPWDLQPTPVPEIDDAINGADQRQITLADGTQAPAADVAKAMMQEAKDGAEKMAAQIEDWFVEGAVYAEMRKVFRDAGRIGTGVLKGPFPVSRKSKKWVVTEGVASLEIVEKIKPTSKRIDPRDFFPDPACGESIHDGSYVVERDYMTARQLRALAKSGGYDVQAIALALKEGPKVGARNSDTMRRDTPGDTARESDVFEIFYYHGDVDPEDLMAMGVAPETMDETAIQLSGIPACVTMVNDRPIKAYINPLETGEFPYDLLTWEPVDGQVWGRGIPRKMHVGQRMVNAACRRMLENAGLAAGVNVVLMKGVIEPMEGAFEITGMKGWFFKPNNDLGITDVRQAFQFFSVPSVQQELMAIIQFALQVIDESTNLPMIMQGQSNREGGASTETVGGMAMALNSANSPLRVIAKQGDDQLFVPHLRRYYDYGMQDPEVPAEAKKDCQVEARGSTALLQREIAKEFLQGMYPIVQDPKSRVSMEKWVAQLGRSQGFDMAQIQYDDEEWKQMQEQASQQPPDPAIQAAQIRSDAAVQTAQLRLQQSQEEGQAKAGEAAKDRAMDLLAQDVAERIEIMKLSQQRGISIEKIKADLASKAMSERSKAQEVALKLSPQNPTNEGI